MAGEKAALGDAHESVESERAALAGKLTTLESEHLALQDKHAALESKHAEMQAGTRRWQEKAARGRCARVGGERALAPLLAQADDAGGEHLALQDKHAALESKHAEMQAEHAAIAGRRRRWEMRTSRWRNTAIRHCLHWSCMSKSFFRSNGR